VVVVEVAIAIVATVAAMAATFEVEMVVVVV
jgi:hypothetical protein